MREAKTFRGVYHYEEIPNLIDKPSFLNSRVFHVAYKKDELFMPSMSFGDVTLYLRTLMFAKQDGRLIHSHKPVTREVLMNLLAMDCARMYVDRAIESGILIKNNGVFEVGKNAVYDNEDSIILDGVSRSVAIGVEGFDYLYNRYACGANISLLGHLFKAIPYINARYNIICHNPDETKLERVIPISASDLMDLLGLPETYDLEFVDDYEDYCITGSNELLVCIDDPLKRSPIIKSVQHYSQGRLLVVNPNLLYSGDRYNYVAWLGGF